MSQGLFKPGATEWLSADDPAVSVEVTSAAVRLYNASETETVYIAFGDVDVEATGSGLPIPPGMVCGFTKPDGDTHLSAYAVAPADLAVTFGDGV